MPDNAEFYQELLDGGKWKTYQSRNPCTIRCILFGHKKPSEPPEPPNGHSPSNYTRCPRRGCGAFLKWNPLSGEEGGQQ